jgi:anhydro-N-acetylmuramic acid kinase
LQFVNTDREYGHYLGQLVHTFIKKNDLQVDFISSHGHTIFHQPEKKITVQIGNGAALSAASGCSVVCDFRSLDVALGGQGAPLVPIGDRFLFSEYEYCLNIGGIANISFEKNSERIAFDICPANMVLNALAQEEGIPFDADGNLARDGKINHSLLDELNAIDFYSQLPPKSLGREGVDENFFPVLKKNAISTRDKLSTCCEHIAIQVSKGIDQNNKKGKMLITGGGAFNKFLVERIAAHLSPEVVLPAPAIINYKEALIFAFLGVLRWRDEVNCLKKVTGAISDSSGGAIYINNTIYND